jgi:hypothetical protein
MRQRRLAAVLAVLALLLQGLAPLGMARAERSVICGTDGPVTVLIDLASGQPIAPAAPADREDCCVAGAHCGGSMLGTPGAAIAHAGAPLAARPAGASRLPGRELQGPVRARAPPPASQL